MKAIMLANAIIELGWIAAMVYFVATGHNHWAAASLFVAAWLSCSITEHKG